MAWHSGVYYTNDLCVEHITENKPISFYENLKPCTKVFPEYFIKEPEKEFTTWGDLFAR